MKQVIFIGGTSYSGSTFLQFILANDPAGFAIGESQWLFYPNTPAHIKAFANASEAEHALWMQIRRQGVRRLFPTIFEAYPDVSFIVEASKHPVWIKKQSQWLRAAGIDVKHLLIWKSPLEFASSFKKRGFHLWAAEWLRYHRLYFSLIPEWRTISYQAAAVDANIWQSVCAYLDIPYFPQKTTYWQKQHLAFGGNYSARFHLVDEDRAQRDFLDKTFDPDRMGLYRRIYYTPVDDPELEARVERAMTRRLRLRQILECLQAADVAQPNSLPVNVPEELPFPPVNLRWRQLKYTLRTSLSRLRYGRSLP